MVRVFLLSWERMGSGLLEIIVSSKAVPKVLYMKYRSEIKHGFTNRCCLRCAFLKVLMVFRKKEPTSQRIYNFSFKILKVRLIVKSFKMFKSNMKFTRAAC